MTATDELRKLLDERGVEHYDGTERTLWGYEQTGEDTGIYRFAASEISGGFLQFDMFRITPEQAIAATLGVETCTIGDYKDPDYGYTHSAMWNDEWFVPSGRCSGCGEYIPVWNYCPKCGRKVES